MVYYKCTETCNTTLQKILTVSILDILLNRSIAEKAGSICHYMCIKELNMNNIKRNGRWGFRPILGMTEFYSSLFSFTNLIVNLISYKYFVYPYITHIDISIVFKIQYHIQNIAFMSSTLFHIHENSVTRFLDYSFAVLVLVYALYLSTIRILMIYKLEKRMRISMRCVFVFYYMYHLCRMSIGEFDYVYNKVSCILIIGLTFVFHIFLYMKYRQFKYARNLLLFTVLFFIGGYIEIQDIPPYSYTLDSHALWHFFSIMSTPFYMMFWGDDIRHHEEVYNSRKLK